MVTNNSGSTAEKHVVSSQLIPYQGSKMHAHLHTNTITFVLYLFLLIGATIFASGYFPLSFSNDVRASFEDLPTSLHKNGSPDDHFLQPGGYRSHFNRTVIMIIDALRLDFITQRPENMPHVHNALRSGSGGADACLLNVHVHSPTVTLPRIKVCPPESINGIIVKLNRSIRSP